MIGLLKYGCGLPFNRLEKLETSLGVPLPAATQWEVVRKAASHLEPAYGELIRQATLDLPQEHDNLRGPDYYPP
jgi:hypothetical protein